MKCNHSKVFTLFLYSYVTNIKIVMRDMTE